ncbi:aminopeptidase P family protein [Pseudoroseicyclus aestuarii]|uniref:Xaa-Pro aminopeptidase n=1 Tax=Pseudoroseicyclus aestuarii TaxID=1795041 RepID=A0A318SUN1_9RHOB|nr:aminopeptidase P family protein [Pseudoroseicyclus aestuarii]PYE82510.1 Xaa-Pro aminopeptidase [Pseudoroseicyclus aestuarii]
MFQTFTASARPEQGPPRLDALRAAMREAGVDAWLVPRADAHRGENVPEGEERLAWLTGFTGSAGFAAITQGAAGVFIDGRYRVQVKSQVADVFTPVPWPETGLAEWLAEALPSGGRLGFDPWLHTPAELAELRAALEPKGFGLIPLENLIDGIWTDRPARSDAPFYPHPLEVAGESHADKRARIARTLAEAGHRSTVLSLPDSIAWLLNIRGADIARTPVPLSFAVLYDDGRAELFCRPGKAEALADHLGPDVTVLDEEAFLGALGQLPGPVRVDPKSIPEIVVSTLKGWEIEIAEAPDPVVLPKAQKNETELAGMREAHLRDGAAVCSFLAWLDEEAPKGALTEIAVAQALEGFRRETNALRDISFETISGAGPHGAVVHYRVTEETDRAVTPGDLLLVDSGGQYDDGTTDITRTIAVGEAGAEEAQRYTLVLRGMIAISRARFPKGLAGRDLDALARAPLWAEGLDYDHGTGHGVGAYLSVHEGPAGLSRRNTEPLAAGMVISNEPGYYKEGAYGIRIENLLAVTPAPDLPGADDRPMLSFETLTWVPLDRRLILADRLTQAERDWIDRYHADTLRLIGPRVSGPVGDWLKAACAPL